MQTCMISPYLGSIREEHEVRVWSSCVELHGDIFRCLLDVNQEHNI